MLVLIELAALFATMTLPPIVRAQDGSALFAIWGCGTRGRARISECHRGRRNHQLPERSAVAAECMNLCCRSPGSVVPAASVVACFVAMRFWALPYLTSCGRHSS